MRRDPAAVGPPPARVEVTELDGRLNLFDPDSAEVLVLNETASEVWRLADGSLTVDEIAARLAPVFGAEVDAIRDDVAALVDDLRSRGLLSDGGPAAAGP